MRCWVPESRNVSLFTIRESEREREKEREGGRERERERKRDKKREREREREREGERERERERGSSKMNRPHFRASTNLKQRKTSKITIHRNLRKPSISKLV